MGAPAGPAQPKTPMPPPQVGQIRSTPAQSPFAKPNMGTALAGGQPPAPGGGPGAPSANPDLARELLKRSGPPGGGGYR